MFCIISFLKRFIPNIMGKREMDHHLSRTGVRGETKKNGAGGKFTWGKPGDEMDIPPTDPNDPVYESPEEEEDTQDK